MADLAKSDDMSPRQIWGMMIFFSGRVVSAQQLTARCKGIGKTLEQNHCCPDQEIKQQLPQKCFFFFIIYFCHMSRNRNGLSVCLSVFSLFSSRVLFIQRSRYNVPMKGEQVVTYWHVKYRNVANYSFVLPNFTI